MVEDVQEQAIDEIFSLENDMFIPEDDHWMEDVTAMEELVVMEELAVMEELIAMEDAEIGIPFTDIDSGISIQEAVPIHDQVSELSSNLSGSEVLLEEDSSDLESISEDSSESAPGPSVSPSYQRPAGNAFCPEIDCECHRYHEFQDPDTPPGMVCFLVPLWDLHNQKGNHLVFMPQDQADSLRKIRFEIDLIPTKEVLVQAEREDNHLVGNQSLGELISNAGPSGYSQSGIEQSSIPQKRSIEEEFVPRKK